MADLAGTENRTGIQKSKTVTPPTARERTPGHRSIPEFAVRCPPPRNTSEITAEPEE